MPITTRGPQGKAIRAVETAEYDAEAARLRSMGLSFRQVGATMGCDVATAHRRVERALAAIPAEGADVLRQLEEARLDEMWAVAWELMTEDRTAWGVSKTGDAVDLGPDYRLKLQAVSTLLAIQARRAKLRGLDAPTRKIVEVITEDTVEAAIRALEEEMAREGVATPPNL